MMMPAMAAPITASPGVATFPASEAILIIMPPFCSCMLSMTARDISSGAMIC
ncbi:hypothetical protein D3C85_1583110 [compost metagenome]